jgi:putative hemolysin
MTMRTLTLFLILTATAHADLKANSKLDQKAIRLIDPATKSMHNFHEVKGIHVYPADGKSYDATYAAIKKQVDAIKKDTLTDLKGNPASFFCTEKLKGTNLTYQDLAENEYAICKLPDGNLVDAWDVFRFKKK